MGKCGSVRMDARVVYMLVVLRSYQPCIKVMKETAHHRLAKTASHGCVLEGASRIQALTYPTHAQFFISRD